MVLVAGQRGHALLRTHIVSLGGLNRLHLQTHLHTLHSQCHAAEYAQSKNKVFHLSAAAQTAVEGGDSQVEVVADLRNHREYHQDRRAGQSSRDISDLALMALGALAVPLRLYSLVTDHYSSSDDLLFLLLHLQ